MAEGTPARIDRAALERVIQRAAELQTSERDPGESLTPEQVLALGREVGIPGQYLQQALLEERTRIVAQAPAGLLDRVVGPGAVAAQRVVRGDPGTIQRMLVRWMEEQELFCVQRQQPGRITWEPLGGIPAAIRRSTAALGAGRKPFMLSRADEVSATLVALEGNFSHVALSASVKKARGEHVGGGAAVATAGVAGSTIMLVLGALVPVALLPLPIALGLGYGVMRRLGPAVARTQLGLERALDNIEQSSGKPPVLSGERGAGIMGLLAEEMRRVLKA
ncbi:MAG: hypothetical protein H0W67_08840 [Gemmatimonadales bacterium]|nr:hypothetical protein [Gemmatimonadales bacterium]